MTIRGNFHVPIYECDVTIIVTDHTKASLNYYYRRDELKSEDFDFEGLVWRPDERIGAYFVFFDLNSLSINTFNHEKSHLVEWILKDRSISAQNEVRSYLDGFISKKMNDFFQKRKLKLK
jgi:hypothetical protein